MGGAGEQKLDSKVGSVGGEAALKLKQRIESQYNRGWRSE